MKRQHHNINLPVPQINPFIGIDFIGQIIAASKYPEEHPSYRYIHTYKIFSTPYPTVMITV